MFVELNDNVIIIAGKYRAEPKLSMLDLGSLGVGRFAGHYVRAGSSIGDCNNLTYFLSISTCMVYSGLLSGRACGLPYNEGSNAWRI